MTHQAMSAYRSSSKMQQRVLDDSRRFTRFQDRLPAASIQHAIASGEALNFVEDRHFSKRSLGKAIGKTKDDMLHQAVFVAVREITAVVPPWAGHICVLSCA